MRGIQNANGLAVLWSGGERTIADQGTEYLLTVEIARALFKAQRKKNGGFAFLEEYPDFILRNAEKKRGRLPSDLRMFGRIDIVLSDKTRNPRVILEVKKDVGSISSDARRIAQILRRFDRAAGGTIRYGVIAVIRVLEYRNIERAMARVRKVCGRLQEEITDFEFRIEEPSRVRCSLPDGVLYIFAFCLTMHRL